MTLVPATSHGSGLVLAQPFSLTAAQIKSSTLTPVTIVAAPGANTMIVPLAYAYAYTFVTTPYSAGAVDLVYAAQDLNVLLNVLDQASSQAGWALGVGLVEGDARALFVNQPIKLAANLRGSIAASSLNGGGTGYVVGDTGTIDDGSPLATYRVDSIGPLGAVVTYTLTGTGGSYTLGAGRTTTTWTTTKGGAQPGVGVGFSVTVTSVDASGSAGDGTLAGAVYYVVATV